MLGKMMPGRMDHDPGSACSDCGMPGDLCTCDAMDQCEGDYCKELPDDDEPKGRKK